MFYSPAFIFSSVYSLGFGFLAGLRLWILRQFKSFWPPALVRQAPPAIIFQALRRLRGAALFRSLRPSSSWGFPFWLLGLRKPCITQHHLCLLHPFFHLVNFPSLRAQVFARRQAFEAFFGTCNRFLGALMQSGPTALATTSAAPSTNCPAQTRCATAARSSSDPGSAL